MKQYANCFGAISKQQPKKKTKFKRKFQTVLRLKYSKCDRFCSAIYPANIQHEFMQQQNFAQQSRRDERNNVIRLVQHKYPYRQSCQFISPTLYFLFIVNKCVTGAHILPTVLIDYLGPILLVKLLYCTPRRIDWKHYRWNRSDKKYRHHHRQ